MIFLRKLIIILLFLVLSIPSSIAQSNLEFTGAVLWKVSGKDLQKASFILGTHHLVDKSYIDSIAGLDKAIENTDQLVGEIYLSDMKELEKKVQLESRLSPEEDYRIILTEKEYNELDQNLTSFTGMGLSQLGQFKPGLISTLLAINMYKELNPTFNQETHLPIDIHLQKSALESGKSVLGLESIDDQIYALFNATPMEQQMKELVCQTGAASIEYSIESLKKLNIDYRLGNLTDLYAIMHDVNDPCPTEQRQKDILLKDRNDKWIVQLPQIMREKSSLIAVGALHLAGEEGLLFQLHKMGYIIEAMGIK